MLTSFIIEARLWRLAWQHRLAELRFRAAGSLLFVGMLGLPALAMGGIVYFAYWNGAQMQLQAERREAVRAQQRAKELRCLAENVYFEARGEPLEGQYAVAEVTLNRTQAPNFPHTICGVVHETRWDPGRRRYIADFSWTELGAVSPDNEAAWKQAMAVATAEYDDVQPPVVPGALYYHSRSLHLGWSRTRKKIAVIGNHIFYQ